MTADHTPDDLPPIHRLALVSVVAGAVAFALLFVEPMGALIVSLPSLTSGVWARREIAASTTPVRGHDLAGYGLALGAATILLCVALLVADLVVGGS